MIQYQRLYISNSVFIGTAGALPPALLGLEDQSLANLSWVDPALGFSDQGFVPVVLPDPLPPPVAVISMRQARLELFSMGMLDEVTNAVANVGGAAQIEFEYASTINQSDTYFKDIATGFGWSQSYIDGFFANASLL